MGSYGREILGQLSVTVGCMSAKWGKNIISVLIHMKHIVNLLIQVSAQIEPCHAPAVEDARQPGPRAAGEELHGPDLAVDAAERLPGDGRPGAVPEGRRGGHGDMQQAYMPR